MSSSPKTAIYPGSFDPITLGHIDVIERAVKIFDRVVVTVASHRDKSPLFNLEERIDMIGVSTKQFNEVEVTSSEGLIVKFAEEQRAVSLIRGLRFVSDIEFEFQLAWMNRHLNAEVITVFLMTDARYTHLNSSLLREVTTLGGNVDDFVTPYVSQKLKEKLNL
ncbi:MAG TPA: pantetheine-phosphate adenylyltransferase [Candidatus Marinimicrobia bacterium]|jgi:pantetheine-phosphate adenylyltransferase|nr:pantetheine-phosphate adenylyltransferase [Candidatus Neomarinimicrobiota bacterium]|tara:strand:+ start:149 stop:640 length:492 start_codon:yes stop_codon:yes gene_type:complete